MQGQHFIVYNDETWANAIAAMTEYRDQHGWMRIKYDNEKQRTLSQNALFNVWVRQIAATLSKCGLKEVTEHMHDDTKRAIKRAFYRSTGAQYILREKVDPITGEKSKDVESTARLTPGEMFELMEWVQMWAASRDFPGKPLILESLGEFKELRG